MVMTWCMDDDAETADGKEKAPTFEGGGFSMWS
jgi:hypothetical protein